MKSLHFVRENIRRTLIYLLAVLSIVYIVAASGRYSLFPGMLSVTVNGVRKETYTDKGGVIIDSSSQRAIILTTDGSCKEVLTSGIKGETATYYSTAAIGADGIYIGEYDRKEDRAYLVAERIVRYDFAGRKLGTAFQIDYTDASRTLVPVMQDIAVRGDKAIALCLNPLKHSIYLTSFSPTLSQAKSTSQKLSLPCANPLAAYFAPSDPSAVIIRDKQGNFYRMESSGAVAKAVKSADEAQGIPALAADCNKDGQLFLTFKSAKEGVTLSCTKERQIVQILFYLCCIYLAVCALYLLIRKMQSYTQQKNYNAINKIISAMLIILLSVFVVAFYSISLITSHERALKKSLEGVAATLYIANPEPINKCLKSYLTDKQVDPSLVQKVETHFESTVRTLDRLGYGFRFCLFAHDKAGEYILGDASSAVLTGEKLSQDTSLVSTTGTWKTGLSFFHSRFSKIIACSYPLKDGQGNIYGHIGAYLDMGIYLAKVRDDFFSRTLLLLSILITVGFLLTEIKACIFCLAQRKKMRAQGLAHTEITMLRPLTFLNRLSSAVNSTLLVVIVKEIAVNSGMGENGILLALPVTAYSLGYAFGAPVKKLMTQKMSPKRALQLSCLISALCYAICFYSVTNSLLILFTVAIFISNIFQAVINTYCQLLTFQAQNISTVNIAISTATVSASSIASVVAGFLAGMYGNGAIQLLGIFACIVTALFITFTISADLNAENAKEDNCAEAKTWSKDIKTLFTDPIMLGVIICVLIPIVMFDGYKSYLFPYVASQAGIDKSTISNISAFCNALYFYLASLARQRKTSLDSQTSLLLALGGVSVIFMLFCLNSSVVWVVLVLALSTVAVKIANPLSTTLWQKRVLQLPADKENANLLMNYVNRSILTAHTTVLGCLLQMLGFVGACFTCGVMGAVGLGAFIAITKKYVGHEEKA